jgi:DNA-binding response OmpR family regulator
MGLQVFAAPSTERASRILDSMPIDVLILNTITPNEDADLRWAAGVRRRQPELTTMVVTGRTTEALEARCDTLGVAAYFVKPVSLRTVRRCIARAMRCRAQRTELRRLAARHSSARAGSEKDDRGDAHVVDDLWFAILEMLVTTGRSSVQSIKPRRKSQQESRRGLHKCRR